MMREILSGYKNIAPISSIPHNESMGRPKNFSREGVLEKALLVFWKHGFADTSLQDLEKATGVNKSGLYAEFADKGDLYLESLRHYLRKRQEEELLTAKPLGWNNIERFLKLGPCNLEGQKGCFSVNSMKPTVLAEMILTFFTGITMEQHLNVGKASMNRKVDDFMKVVRQL